MVVKGSHYRFNIVPSSSVEPVSSGIGSSVLPQISSSSKLARFIRGGFSSVSVGSFPMFEGTSFDGHSCLLDGVGELVASSTHIAFGALSWQP